MQSGPSVAIVGAGFSGALMALHLLQQGPPDLRVRLIERRGGFGPGLAYGACEPEHLLNVRVGNMSAFPDAPGHLAEWLSARGHQAHDPTFISRGTYGQYLSDMILRAVGSADGAERLLLAPDEATRVRRTAGGFEVAMAMGNTHQANAVVIAAGNLAPGPGAGVDRLPPPVYARDPWAAGALDALDPAAPVLLLGTGLTMVDVAVSLETRGHRGQIIALSRRGLLPRAHGRFSPLPTKGPDPQPMRLSHMVRWVRHRAAEVGWWEAIDSLRPVTQAIWRRADLATRRRFLRHLRPWWDVHRHRMAPAIADCIGELRAGRRLTILAGRVTQTAARGEGVDVTWRPRGRHGEERLHAARIVNCTGPGGSPAETREPLILDLLGRGDVRPDPLGLGLEVDSQCQVIGRSGKPDPRLYAIGPITRGSFWETVAVPDIRNQVAAVAAHIAGQLAAPRRSSLSA